MSEWRDGDVAMVTQLGGGVERRAIHFNGRWHADIGAINAPYAQHARRLAVIDPDDRAQVERLCNLWFGDGDPAGEASVTEMQAALREFANPTPPKPTVTPEMVAAMRQQLKWDREQSGYWQERERDHRGLSAVDAWLDSLADHLGVTE